MSLLQRPVGAATTSLRIQNPRYLTESEHGMENDLGELHARLCRLEDESAITRLVLSYGPAADAGLTKFAGQLWTGDGEYDWDANGTPIQGDAGVDAMLQGERHQNLIATGVAHFAGPPRVTIHADVATALNYSLVMRREGERFFLWRVSAVRWDLVRTDVGWRIKRRTNRLLDETGHGRELFDHGLTEPSEGSGTK